MTSRRKFISNSVKATGAVYLGAIGFSAKSYARIIGANDRVGIGVVGFSDRFRSSLFPSFMNHQKEMNFDTERTEAARRSRRAEHGFALWPLLSPL